MSALVLDETVKSVCRRVLQWGSLVDELCLKQRQERWLVLGLIATESGGDPWAIRCEPLFWKRYGETFRRNARGNARKWARFPDVASASYGLGQVLYVTATELGFDPAYPTQLCDPHYGLTAALTKLRRCYEQTMESRTPTESALLRYNGGGDTEYPRRVLEWKERLMQFAGQLA